MAWTSVTSMSAQKRQLDLSGDKMASIKQHIPNYVSGVDPETVEFNTLSELLDISFVKHWRDWTDRSFHQYSVCEESWGTVLMAEYNNGTKWWVVGYLKDTNRVELGLLDWNPNRNA